MSNLPDQRVDPPPEPEELELPESLAKAQKARRAMESAGIELAEDDLLTPEQDATWECTLEAYDRLLLAAEERAVEMAEANQGRAR